MIFPKPLRPRLWPGYGLRWQKQKCPNGLLVFLGAWSGGGSGTFYYLHILDAVSSRAFDEDGSTYSRLDLTLVRTLHPRRPLGGATSGSRVIPFASSPTRATPNAAWAPPPSMREGHEAHGSRPAGVDVLRTEHGFACAMSALPAMSPTPSGWPRCSTCAEPQVFSRRHRRSPSETRNNPPNSPQ